MLSLSSRAWLVLAVFLSLSCSGGGGGASQPGDWNLWLEVDGSEVAIPLEVMHVFLVDDKSHPEIYEVLGEGVTLVGEFPSDVHVGYGAEWSVLFGRSIWIAARGGDPREPKQSAITVPGKGSLPVVGGSLTPEELTGEYAGMDGDLTLSGRVRIKVREGGAEVTYRGRFAVHGVTWR